MGRFVLVHADNVPMEIGRRYSMVVLDNKTSIGQIFLALVLLSLAAGCRKEQSPPPSADIPQILSHRNLGLAYLEENRLQDAESEFKKLIELAPGEALGPANLGLVYLRLGRYDEAEKQVRTALKIAPGDPNIRLILAEIYERSGKLTEAIQVLRETLNKHPEHKQSHYKIAQLLLHSGEHPPLAEVEAHLRKVLEAAPATLPVRLQLIEVLLQMNRKDQALSELEEVRRQLPELPQQAETFYEQTHSLIQSSKFNEAMISFRMFQNLIKPTPFYQTWIIQLNGPGGGSIGFPVTDFSEKLYTQVKKEKSFGVHFVEVPVQASIQENQKEAFCDIAIGDFDGDSDPDVYLPMSGRLLQNNRGTFQDVTARFGPQNAPKGTSATFVDYDNDGYLDLFIAGNKFSALFRNERGSKFVDVTQKTGIRIPGGRAVFVDFDQDGDLDIYSGLHSFRNNSDGSFSEVEFAGHPASLRDAAFADFDLDGDVDLVTLDQNGKPALFTNLRQSHFQDITSTSGFPAASGFSDIEVADYNNDGAMDVLFTGTAIHLMKNSGTGKFVEDQQSAAVFQTATNIQPVRACFFDFDNDGLLDILIQGNSMILLENYGNGNFKDASAILPAPKTAVCLSPPADFDVDGDLDLLAFKNDGTLLLLRNDGGNINHWLNVQAIGLGTESGKNNRYGIGAQLEVKAGELYQMQVVTSPVTHFGLGPRKQADVVRIIWTNGVPQNQFLAAADQTLIEKQILKGSCMFLYAWNGRNYSFVTDVLWKSALGMPLGIMAGTTKYAFPDSTDEYLKIPGELLKPRDGFYSIQLTEELWETPYLDHFQLVAVDHPSGVDVYVDEKFVVPPLSPLKIYSVKQKRSPVSATDENGKDLLPEVRYQDDRYTSNFIPTKYQGIAKRHELILDPGDLSSKKQVLLFLRGWLFPTDASINVAISQRKDVQTVPPTIQVRDRTGQWRTVIPNAGFPMGKDKTMIVDLTGKFLSNDYHVKIVTTMQLYWDHVFFSTDENVPSPATQILEPITADLHYRGFSLPYRKGVNGPHWFDYSQVDAKPHWRDLVGQYTRYGDVIPLLKDSDDRCVIINAGDELTLRFDASKLPPLRPGWSRDFLIYADGWMKDGDLNTAFSQTVEPLPYHGLSAYPYGPGDHYPLDEFHRQYLATYNTRKLTPAIENLPH